MVGRMKPPVRDERFVVLLAELLFVVPLDAVEAAPPELAMLVLLGVLFCNLLRTVF